MMTLPGVMTPPEDLGSPALVLGARLVRDCGGSASDCSRIFFNFLLESLWHRPPPGSVSFDVFTGALQIQSRR